MTTATCEICRIEGPESSFEIGWGIACRDNPECRPPMTRPKRREVATLTPQILDDLEWEADDGERRCNDAEVVPSVLRALIDAARRDMERTPGDWNTGQGIRPAAFALVERELREVGITQVDGGIQWGNANPGWHVLGKPSELYAHVDTLIEAVDAAKKSSTHDI